MCFHLSQAYFLPANSLTVISNMRAEQNLNTRRKVTSKIETTQVVTCEKNILFISHVTTSFLRVLPVGKFNWNIYKGPVFKFNLSMCRAEVFTIFYVEADTEEETRPVWNYCGSSSSWETQMALILAVLHLLTVTLTLDFNMKLLMWWNITCQASVPSQIW